PYNYVPTKWVCALFLALFSLSTGLHFAQALRYRLWWLLPTAVVAGILEIVGWSARLKSSSHPHDFNPYIIQISTTILAPTPLVAANFIILGRIITRLGPRYSRLNAKWWPGLMVSLRQCIQDTIALVVQAIGGSVASGAVHRLQDPTPGGNIMLGGIVFQLAAIVAYVTLAAEFLLRYIKDRPVHRAGVVTERRGRTDPRTKILLMGMGFMTICILIRSVYRTIELADGWNGKVISTQVLFNVLDGAMISLAMLTLNIVHPGIFLARAPVGDAETEVVTEQADPEQAEEKADAS
ncbi:RTA1-domain-containing protein, partial [Auriscalpium vulgare]